MEKYNKAKKLHFEKSVSIIENMLCDDNLQFIEDVMSEVMSRFKSNYELFKRGKKFGVVIEYPNDSLSSQHLHQ